jgi:hypothetical protein
MQELANLALHLRGEDIELVGSIQIDRHDPILKLESQRPIVIVFGCHRCRFLAWYLTQIGISAPSLCN